VSRRAYVISWSTRSGRPGHDRARAPCGKQPISTRWLTFAGIRNLSRRCDLFAYTDTSTLQARRQFSFAATVTVPSRRVPRDTLPLHRSSVASSLRSHAAFLPILPYLRRRPNLVRTTSGQFGILSHQVWYPVASGSGISRETDRNFFWNLRLLLLLVEYCEGCSNRGRAAGDSSG
jgi:hypothetical protein